MEERQVDVAIIGSGSAGLYAMSRVRPSGKSVVLINGGELGTTCARVGCMPSKAVIQVAEEYPITPKEHGAAFLLDHRHLWIRSKRQA